MNYELLTMCMRILVFDNYDSFTYNLVHLVGENHCCQSGCIRNDKIALEKIKDYDKIILSPGPGIPVEEAIAITIDQRICRHQIYFGFVSGTRRSAKHLEES